MNEGPWEMGGCGGGDGFLAVLNRWRGDVVGMRCGGDGCGRCSGEVDLWWACEISDL